MKELAGELDAVPGKRLFLAIIVDYDLNRSICELIDNALDNWINNGKSAALKVGIDIDTTQQTIQIKDNSGGIKKDDLKIVISPGETSNDPNSEIIGIFGVGTKRAVIALALDVKIKSRYTDKLTYLVEFDDDWLQENNDWTLPYYKVNDIDQSTTILKLQSLRYEITDDMVERLKEHLKSTYAKFIMDGNFEIDVNGDLIEAELFENWAYPPTYLPTKYSGVIETDEGNVNVRIIAGLSKESSPATGEYGVYFYCNNRLIVRALKSFEVGFGTGLAGKPHPNISLIRVIISLEGSAKLMPWNSSKSGIYYEHKIFLKLQELLMKIVKQYAKISRALEGEWPDKIFQYTSGVTQERNIDFGDVSRLHLPPVPLSRPRFKDKVKQENKALLSSKPWTKGIIGGIIATDIVYKKKFDEKNRVVIIILDSTLEIAFKEYLVKESGHHYSDADLLRIFKSRHLVENEVKNYPKGKNISNRDWGKIRHYYDLRCKLIHQRASVNINDEDIEDYRKVIERVLKKLFRFKFNQ